MGRIARLLILANLFLAATFAWAGGVEELTLRVSDAEAVPGGVAAVTLRTYASRPVAQGQVCLQSRAVDPGQAPAIAEHVSTEVFAAISDVVSTIQSDLLADPQSTMVDFSSQTSSINADDGPLAVFFLQIHPDVQPGAVYEFSIDDLGTDLIDRLGASISRRDRVGELIIRAPEDPVSVGTEGEDTLPGGQAVISFQTKEPVHLSGGRVVLTWDAEIAAGAPTVKMDARHGEVDFVADTTIPGRVVVDFNSKEGTANRVPGNIVQVFLPTRAEVPRGSSYTIHADMAETELRDVFGAPIPIRIDEGELEFPRIAGGPVGEIAGLRLGKDIAAGSLELFWFSDCGGATEYAIYRGDLRAGYESLEIEPGRCLVSGISTIVPYGTGESDFFLIVPQFAGLEGGYGETSEGRMRTTPAVACYPQGLVLNECVDGP